MSKFIATALAATMLMPIAARAEGQIEVLHHWVSQSEVDALNVIRKELEAKGFQWKDSAVGGMSGANAQQALRARLTAGDPPGAMQFLGWEGVQWAEQGVVRDLNDLAKTGGWREALAPQLLPFVTSGEAFIAAPINMHRQNWVWANKKIFDDAGVSVPKSWAELIETGKKLKEKGIVPVAMGDEPWQIGIIFDALLSDINGPDFYQKTAIDLDPEALGSAEMVKVFDALRDVRGLVDDNFVGRDWAVATGMVIDGKAAMQFMGDWAKGEFIKAGKKPGTDFVCMRFPGTQGSVTFNSDQFAMFKVADDKVPAQLTMASAIESPVFQSAFNVVKGSAPARTDVSDEAFDDCGKKAIKDLAEANTNGSLFGSMAHGHANPASVKNAIYDVVTRQFNGELSSEEAVTELKAAVEAAK